MPRLEYEREMLARPSEAVILYLYNTVASPILTISPKTGDTVLHVQDTTDVDIGHAVNIHDDKNHFQSLVFDKTVDTITMVSPIDVVFGTNAYVHCGPWWTNVDGSSEPVIYQIHPPTNAIYDIASIVISMSGSSKMSIQKFGGIPSLDNGIVLRKKDGEYKNYFVLVNNIGMSEQGFSLTFYDRAGLGDYGLRALNSIKEFTGKNIRLNGSHESLELIVQDDLTDLSHMSVTVGSHLYENGIS